MTYVCRLTTLINHRLPGSNLVFNSIMFLMALVAWTGLVDRASFASIALKLSLLYSSSLFFAYCSNNFLRLVTYTWRTNSYLEIKEKIMKSSALDWLWIASKILFQDDSYQAFQAILFLGVSWISVWPYRYIYYYQRPPFNSFTHDSVADVFVINLVLHISSAWMWLSLVILILVESPSIFKHERIQKNAVAIVIIFTGFQVAHPYN